MAKKTKPKTKTSVTKKQSTLLQKLKAFRVLDFFILWLVPALILEGFFCRNILRDYSYLETFPRELILPTVMHAFTALLIAMSLFWLKRLGSMTAKLFASVLISMFMLNYDNNLQAVTPIIKAFTPGSTANDAPAITSLLYLVLIFVFSVLVAKGLQKIVENSKSINPRDIKLAIILVSAYLLVIPAFSVFKVLPVMISETSATAPQFKRPKNAPTTKDKPDIYYIVLDRYTNKNVLKDQFDYDNSPFLNSLEENGFYINNNAHSNYPYTAMSVSSTMIGDYHKNYVDPFKDQRAQDRTLFHHLTQQSPVVKALEGQGYQYIALGSRYGASYKNPLAARDIMNEHVLTVFGHGKILRGLEGTEFSRSPYFSFSSIPTLKWWPVSYKNTNRLNFVRKQLVSLNNIATNEAPGGKFIFAHILVPHEPYMFNADGSINSFQNTDNVGKSLKEKYNNQIEFINSEMQELIDKIMTTSNGQAVILLNSDEGSYPQLMNGTFKAPQGGGGADGDEVGILGEDMRKWPQDWAEMKFGILQAVHIPKATQNDLDHLSSVNLFRIVLNRYAGYKLPYLPECHFGVTNGTIHEYNYGDMTQFFVKNPDESCAKLENPTNKNLKPAT